MNKLLLTFVAGLMGIASLPALSAGNVELGKAKSMYCVTCHGADGKNVLPMLTGGSARLAGMDQQKFVSAMKGYKFGQRFHPMMQFFVMPLGDKDIEDMAAYYATLGPNLYERLGGKEAINMVVKDLLANGMADSRLAHGYPKWMAPGASASSPTCCARPPAGHANTTGAT